MCSCIYNNKNVRNIFISAPRLFLVTARLDHRLHQIRIAQSLAQRLAHGLRHVFRVARHHEPAALIQQELPQHRMLFTDALLNVAERINQN